MPLRNRPEVFCPSCGQQVAPGAKFCANCGQALASPATPSPDPATDPPRASGRGDAAERKARVDARVAASALDASRADVAVSAPDPRRGNRSVRTRALAGLALLGVALVAATMLLVANGSSGSRSGSANDALLAPALVPLAGSGTYTGQQLLGAMQAGGCNASVIIAAAAAPGNYQGKCAAFAGTTTQDQNDANMYYMLTMAGNPPSLTGPWVAVEWPYQLTTGPAALHIVIGTIQGGIDIHLGQQLASVPLVIPVDVDNSRMHG